MIIPFEKYNGLGNDFIFIDGMNSPVELTVQQVAFLCDRHFGIGADGVIVVDPCQEADGYMRYINSDGTFAQMCGNGVRCFAKYLVDHGYVDSSRGTLVAQTLAGPKSITFEVDEHGEMTSATVEMGAPVLNPPDVPCLLPATRLADGSPAAVEVPLDTPWGVLRFTAVSMGNPHAVCFIDDFSQLPDGLFSNPEVKDLRGLRLDEIGRWVEGNQAFPEKANAEFACVGPDCISMRVYERGCGETLACGTGACATAVAAALTGRTERSTRVELKGGSLDIDWGADGIVHMTGPAAFSFSGTINL